MKRFFLLTTLFMYSLSGFTQVKEPSRLNETQNDIISNELTDSIGPFYCDEIVFSINDSILKDKRYESIIIDSIHYIYDYDMFVILLKFEINSGRAILCKGYNKLLSEDSVKSRWYIVDGYSSVKDKTHFHLNFGIGGLYNGWYNLKDAMIDSLCSLEYMVFDVDIRNFYKTTFLNETIAPITQTKKRFCFSGFVFMPIIKTDDGIYMLTGQKINN